MILQADTLMREVRARVAQDAEADPNAMLHRRCMAYAHRTRTILTERCGVESMIVAGTFQAEVDPTELIGPNAVAFVFDGTWPNGLGSLMGLAKGILPELHCWNYVPAHDTLIDASLIHLPAWLDESNRTHGTTIKMNRAPLDFFWGSPDEAYRLSLRYTENETASKLVNQLLSDDPVLIMRCGD